MTKFFQYLSRISRNKLKVHRGKIHDFAGMDLDYSKIGIVKVTIIKYLKKILDEFLEEFRGMLVTLTVEYLF